MKDLKDFYVEWIQDKNRIKRLKWTNSYKNVPW